MVKLRYVYKDIHLKKLMLELIDILIMFQKLFIRPQNLSKNFLK